MALPDQYGFDEQDQILWENLGACEIQEPSEEAPGMFQDVGVAELALENHFKTKRNQFDREELGRRWVRAVVWEAWGQELAAIQASILRPNAVL